MEQDSNKSITSGAFHYGPDFPSRQYTTDHISVPETENNWHIYSMIWTKKASLLWLMEKNFITLQILMIGE